MGYVKYYLENPRNEDEAYIRVKVRLNSNSYYRFYLPGEKIRPNDWNPKKHRPRTSYINYGSLNHFLNKVANQIDDLRRKLFLEDKLNKYEMERAIEKYLHKRSYEMFDTFEMLISEKESNPIYSESLARKYRNVVAKLTAFNKSLTFENIDIDFLNKWTSYLFTEYKLSTNTVSRYVKFLKTLLNESTERGYNTCTSYKSRKFSIKQTKTVYPYLTLEELDKIYNTKVVHERHENAKIQLLMGCYSGQRHSDWHRLTLDNITRIGDRDYFRISNQKTRDIVHIPAFEKLKILINKKSHPIANQKFNIYVKELCKLAEIDSTFSKPVYKGNEMEIMTYKKHEIVSSHIARRSFVCNSLLAGVPRHIIMKVGGWTTEDSFNRYCQLSSVDGMNQFDGVFN